MQLVSYLFFDNRAAEAFDFYAKCLGGKVTMKVPSAKCRAVSGCLRKCAT